MKSKLFFLSIILFQISIIIFLSYKIFLKKQRVLGKAVINPIKKENIIQTDTKLKYFYEPKPNTHEIVNEWVPYKATYTINNDALNERFDYEIEKKENVFRIITLGDSFTYGLYVDTKNNWPERLEDKLNTDLLCKGVNKYEVINLGVHGYDIQYSLNRYINRGSKYNPDLIIWFLKEDDVLQVNEIMLEKEHYYAKEMRETGEFQKLVDKGILYPSWAKAMQDVFNEYGKDQILDIQRSFLKEFDNQYKGKLVVVTFPNEPKDVKNFLRDEVSKNKDAVFFDGLDDIYQDSKLYFPNDGHPTSEGHKVIAENIFDYLKEMHLTCY
jgi:lysophospholipase L1-like esterase